MKRIAASPWKDGRRVTADELKGLTRYGILLPGEAEPRWFGYSYQAHSAFREWCGAQEAQP